jgi:hypothetical protein
MAEKSVAKKKIIHTMRVLNRMANKQIIFRYLPAFFLLPLVTTRLPSSYRSAREVAGYFQSLAFARNGFRSYFFLTPEESFSALHLYSILSSPLVRLGYYEGGRLVSLVAAIAAITFVAIISRIVFDDPVIPILAPILLWAHPVFIRVAYAYQPEATSIALTSGVILLLLKYLDTRNEWLFVGCIVLLGLSITNHMWEATIALPVATLLAYEKEWVKLGVISAITPIFALVVLFITGLQKKGAEQLMQYSASATGIEIYFSKDFWIISGPGGLPEPTFPLSVAVMLYLVITAYRRPNKKVLLLLSWLISGLFIIFALPRGFLSHNYYLWAVLVPLALSGAYIAKTILELLKQRADFDIETVVRITAVALLIFSCLWIGIFEAGSWGGANAPIIGESPYGSSTPPNQPIEGINQGEAVAAGEKINKMGINNASSIVFSGSEWETKKVYRETGVSRVLIYSGILVRERRHGNKGPKINPNTMPREDCSAVVHRNASGDIWVTDCSKI